MRHLAVIFMILVSLSGALAAEMTHEEIVVRAAYARLSYAARTGVLLRYAEDARVGRNKTMADLQNELDSQMAFQFRTFNIGNLAEIADTHWDSLVSKPQQDLISVAFGYAKMPMKVGQNDPFSEMSFLTASWQRWEEYDADWSFPVKEVIADLPKDTGKPEILYSRYASYSVTVALAGRQRTYQAIFLFGRNPDGSEAVYFIDHVLGMGVLDTGSQRSLYPQPLLETYMRELPMIAEWISSAGVPSNATAKDVVCDGVSGKCGIPKYLLEKSLSVPIDPETRKFYQLFQSNGAKVAPSTPSTEVRTPSNATSCAGYTASFPSKQVSSGTGDHSSGSHSISQAFNGTCTYTSGGSPNCNSQCQINGTSGQSTQSETGKTVTGYCHVVNLNYSSGDGAATNGASSCTGAALYGGAEECPTLKCDCTVTVSVSGFITGTGKNIWTANVPIPLTCNAETDPTYLSSITVTPASTSVAAGSTQQFTATGNYSGGNTSNLTASAGWTSSSTSVATVNVGLATGNAQGTATITAASGSISGSATLTVSGSGTCGSGTRYPGGDGGGGGGCGSGGGGNGCGSPIVIDTNGDGFHMTDAADGVYFDIRGDAHPVNIAWTGRGVKNAFLALDRNGNGKIDNGEELFGNYTPQPKSQDPNGYAALAEFDKPENGGNGDGVIDKKDAVYSKLLLWIDENHDGISQPNELHHLGEMGVYSLSLRYVDTPLQDAFGNWFRYKGKVNPLRDPLADPVDRTSYDVFFELGAPGPKPPACE